MTAADRDCRWFSVLPRGIRGASGSWDLRRAAEAVVPHSDDQRDRCEVTGVQLPPLPDPAVLDAIEEKFWTPGGAVPLDATLAVRGSPIRGDKFLGHAIRQAREYSLRGANMASISVDLVLPGWPLERILARQLRNYSRFATCEVTALTDESFEVLATGKRPHADVVLPVLGIVEAERLAKLFRLTEARNEYRVRR